MIRKILACSGLVLLVLITGCAALGVPKADTFNKQVIVANSLVESVAETARTLYSSGKISTEDKDAVYTAGTEARADIELLRQLHATDPLKAENRINTLIITLTALQSRLEAQQ
jgi:hypothetical protein